MWQPKHAGVIWLVLVAAGGIGLGLPPMAAAQSNPIVIENQQPGASQWRIPWGSAATDVGGQIKGYASHTSVNKGENITFYVSVNPAQTYTIDVYRMGWYQGLGGRPMQHIGPLMGAQQPTCPTDATTGMIECHWSPAYTLATQTSWTSGIYLAVLSNAQMYQNYIVFVVRDDGRAAPLLYQQPVATYQAYNDYPNDNLTGKSLYGFNSYGSTTVGGGGAAVKVSFNRPYESDGLNSSVGQGFLQWEFALVRWLEQSGYDVTYSTDIDTHTTGSRLLNYRGILSAGHDEYWSKPMYDAFFAARDAGVNLAFFGADNIGWQVRFEPSSSGVPNRVMVCYRNAILDPISELSLKTVEWRDPPLNRPEQTLMGLQYTSQVTWNNGAVPYVVTSSGNWVYAGTGFRDGDSVRGIVGYEADRWYSQYAPPNAVIGTYALLSQSTLGNGGTSDYANSSVYQAASRAWVFASGTMNWSWALDNYNGANVVDPRIQQTTANILNRFLEAGAGPGFTLSASPSSQTVAPGRSTNYSVTISPTGGFSGKVTLSVSGLPSGATGKFTPNPATASSTLSVTTTKSIRAGTYTLTVTGVSGALTRTFTVALVVATPSLPEFTLSASPASKAVTPGGSTSFSVAINPTGGFAGQVTLSVSGLPSGATGKFTPNPATASSTLSVTTSTSTPAGNYTLTITSVSGSLRHTTTVGLVVGAADFTLSASSASQAVTSGGSTSFSVAINPTGSFAGQVTLSVSGLPSAGSGSFTPNPATPSSTLSVTTSTSTPAGSYTLAITGVSGSLTHTTPVSLTVVAPSTDTGRVTYDNKVSSGFQWGLTQVTTPAFIIESGANRAAMIMVAMSANYATGITASLGGVSGTVIPGTDSGTTATIRTLIFQVINPPSGAQTATVSWTTSMNADVGVITVSGADQTTPCTSGTFAASNSTPAPTTSVTISSNSGDLTASVGFTGGNWVTPFTSQTLKWGIDSSAAGGDIGAGTGATTHTWTTQFSSQLNSVSGANFKAAAF